MWKIKNKEAVSPVIGVILMVAITVVLAAVLYVWVSGFMGGGGAMTPSMAMGSITAPPQNSTNVLLFEDNATTTRIVSISTKVTPGDVKWYIYTGAGVSVDYGTLTEGTTSGVKGTGTGIAVVALIDNDGDDKLSTNDVIKIGVPDAALTSGYVFALIYTTTGGEMGRVTFA